MTEEADIRNDTRRQDMLHVLINDMRDVHRRKRRRRHTVSAMVMLAVVCTVTTLVIRNGPSPQQSTDTTHQQVHAGAASELPIAFMESARPRLRFIVVNTDPTVVQRYLATEPPNLVRFIDDDELLDSLQAINRPTGLVRASGSVWLTTAVTDEVTSQNRLNQPRHDGRPSL